MKRYFVIVLWALLLLATMPVCAQLSLWYTRPAEDWSSERLPIGNGRIGAMIMGGIEQDTIQFNDKTLWTGSKTTRGAYQNFGNLCLDFGVGENVTDYRRSLHLSEGIAMVEYRQDGVNYLREYLTSYPDDVIAIRLSANKKGKVNCRVRLDGVHPENESVHLDGQNIRLSGKLTLLSYMARLNVKNDGGKVRTEGNSIVIDHADEVTLILGAGTNYSCLDTAYLSQGEEWSRKVETAVTGASAKKYKALKAAHVADHQNLFGRVELELGELKNDVPTDELFKGNMKDGVYNPLADVLHFQYGRYLAIASSRPGLDLPSNLQGLWNNNNTPPWECDLHSNINVQMNYWPVEVTNLSECHLPFINYIFNESQHQQSWKEMASQNHCKGWTMRTQNNIFGYSDWSWNRPANAWYCMHIWEKYLFDPQVDYLRDTAYPVMKSACEFWLDRMILDANGKWVAPDEWSPEHGPWEDGIAYAQQLISDLFTNTITAGEVLGIHDAFVEKLKEKSKTLDRGLTIGSWGQLREWKKQNDDPKENHRHLSHLIALYPDDAVSPFLDKAYAEAAKKSLDARPDIDMGWSLTWKVSLWARLFDGERAHKLLRKALKISDRTPGSWGIYMNLLNAMPFQIEANFGSTAGVAEMLLQSHLDELHLLPAIPEVWSTGKVSGLRARGGFEVDMKWRDKRIVEGTVKADGHKSCRIRTDVPLKVKGCKFTCQREGEYYITTFVAEQNKKYKIERQS